MTDGPKFVKLRDGRPPLNDIPARLRLLAEELEAGKHGDYESCIVLIPQIGFVEMRDYPMMWGYGDVTGNNNPIITLHMALNKWTSIILEHKTP